MQNNTPTTAPQYACLSSAELAAMIRLRFYQPSAEMSYTDWHEYHGACREWQRRFGHGPTLGEINPHTVR